MKSGTVTVRPAWADELAEAGRVTVAAYRASGMVSKGGRYEEHLADAPGRARDAELLVAVASGCVIGTVTVCRHGSRYAEIAEPDEVEFRMLAVLPEARGAGVGETLVRAVVAHAREIGASAVVLCAPSKATSARRLYQRLGFTRIPDRDWSPVPEVPLLGYRLEI